VNNHQRQTTHNARMAKAERRRHALQPIIDTLLQASAVANELLSDSDPDVRLRAVHAVNQCAQTFVKVYEVGELEYRIDELTEAVEASANRRMVT
jgi:hypothetical protein